MMTRSEFVRAFQSLAYAIQQPRDRKPKNIQCATRGYARGCLAKWEHIEELSGKTLAELYEMAYRLRGSDNAD